MNIQARGVLTGIDDLLDSVDIEEITNAIGVLQHAIHRNNVDKGFWDEELVEGGRRNDGEIIALMHTELSEALEAIRSPEMPMDKHCPKFENVNIELADAVIRICDYAEGRGIDLGAAIIAKMAYNVTRPFKHSRKF